MNQKQDLKLEEEGNPDPSRLIHQYINDDNTASFNTSYNTGTMTG